MMDKPTFETDIIARLIARHGVAWKRPALYLLAQLIVRDEEDTPEFFDLWAWISWAVEFAPDPIEPEVES